MNFFKVALSLLICSGLQAVAQLPENGNWRNTFGGMGVNGTAYTSTFDGTNLFLGGTFQSVAGITASNLARWDGSAWHGDSVSIPGAAWALSSGENGVFAGGSFQATNGLFYVLKWTGAQWVPFGTPLDEAVYAVAQQGTNLFAGGNFRFSGTQELDYLAQWDGARWKPVHAEGASGFDSAVQSIFVNTNGDLYAGGFFSSVGGMPVKGIARWDGTAWSDLGGGLIYANDYGTSGVPALAITQWRGDIYAAGRFTLAGGMPASRVARWDGSNWHPLGTGLGTSTDSTIEGRALFATEQGIYLGGSFYQAGSAAAIGFAKWDGSNWMAGGADFQGSLNLIGETAQGLVVGGPFTSIGDETFFGLAEFSNGGFKSFGSEIYGPIFVMKQEGERVIFGGDFSRAGSKNTLRVAEYRAGNFFALGSGMDAAVRAIALAPDGRVFAGGEFATAGDRPAKGLAQWDGEHWSALGAGLSGPNVRVNALEFHDGKLFAGGTFNSAGAVQATNIAVWDGTNWSSVGSANLAVTALAWYQDRLYAGGSFTSIGSASNLHGLASWEPASNRWTNVGGGALSGDPNGVAKINDLESGNDGLYVAGVFGAVGGKKINNIARWNGVEWLPLGVGITNSINGEIYAIKLRGKEVYAGGSFGVAPDGENFHYHIAHFDGTKWSHLGDVIHAFVHGFAIRDNDLYVGGEFAPPALNVWRMPSVNLSNAPASTPLPALANLQLNAAAVNFFAPATYFSIYQAGNLLGTSTGSLVWSNLAAGSYSIYAAATNSNGDRIESPALAIIVAQPAEDRLPLGDFLSPTNQAAYVAGEEINFRFAASDTDGSVQKIQLLENGILLGEISGPGEPLVISNLPPGTHQLMIKTIDNLGGSTLSIPITIVVNPLNELPFVFIQDPFPHEWITTNRVPILVEASDSDGSIARVEFREGSALLAAVTSTNNQFSWIWTNAPSGERRLTARAIDDRGGMSEREISFSITTPDSSGTFQQPIPSANPFSQGWITDGEVHAILQTNGVVYVGGEFNNIAQQIPGSSVVELSAEAPDLSYPPIDGIIDVIVSDGSGGYYLGGLFRKVGTFVVANAAHVFADKSVDTNWAPNPNGHVIAIAAAPDKVFLGGEFTEIAGQNQRYLASVARTNGALFDWHPLLDSWVSALALNAQSLYVGGNFRSVGGAARSYLAAIEPESAQLLSWNGHADNYVEKIKISGDRIYVSGPFGTLDGTPQSSIGALDLVSGNLVSWNPRVEGAIRDFIINGSMVYLGGNFGRVAGVDRRYLAAVTVTNAQALAWAPQPDGAVWSMALLNQTIYLSGEFTEIGGAPRNRNAAVDAVAATVLPLDFNTSGTFASMTEVENKVLGAGGLGLLRIPRKGLAAFDAGSGFAKEWDPKCDGSVYALGYAGNILYAGGAFSSLGGAQRSGLGAVDAITGVVTSWKADASSVVRALAVSDHSIFVGGDFLQISGLTREYIAEVDRTSGAVTLWRPILDDAVMTVALDGDNIYLGGSFKNVYGEARHGLAEVDSNGLLSEWNPNSDGGAVRQILATEDQLYILGSFGSIGGQMRDGLAALDKKTGRATAWKIQKTGSIASTALMDSTLFVGGQFTEIGNLARTNIAAIDVRLRDGYVLPWAPGVGVQNFSSDVVEALSVSGDAVFLGGRFQDVAGESRQFFAGFPFGSELDTLAYVPRGLFQMRLIGPLGKTYIFEVSTNLIQWTPILTNRAPFLFEDVEAVNFPLRFYRASPQTGF